MQRAIAIGFAILSLSACGGGGGDDTGPGSGPAPQPAPAGFRGLSHYEVPTWGSASALARLEFEDGSSLRIEGERAEDGMPSALTRIDYRSASSAQPGGATEGTLELGAQATPGLLITPEGSRLKMNWDAARGKLDFVYLSADGSKQAVSTVDLRNPAAKAGPQNSATGRQWRELLPLGSGGATKAAAAAAKAPLAISTSTKTVSVDVRRCNQPVEDATVEISYRPDNLSQWLPSRTYAKHAGNGRYVAGFHVLMGLEGAAGKTCKAVAGVLGSGCEITKSFKDQEAQVCTAVAAAIDTALGGPTGEGIVIATQCTAALKSYNAYCAVHDGPVDGSEGLSAADFVCNSIAALEDALPAPGETPYTWSAKAFVEGRTASSATQIVPYKDDVVLLADFGGVPSIVSLTTLPFDPLPLADYVVSAGSSCTRDWTSTLQVFGSDGYTSSSSTPNSSDPSYVNLSVPGADAGVSDRLVFTVNPPGGGTAAPLRREIGVTF